MPTDPRQPPPMTTTERGFDQLTQVARRVSALERRGSRVPVGSGLPPESAADVPEGSSYIDRDGLRVYYVVSGVWRSHPLS